MAKCKYCRSGKQNISCSLCRQRKSSKFQLIDWKQTKLEYNYDDDYILQKIDNIIISCACGKSKPMLWRSVRKYSATCRSCTSKALWEDQEYRNKLDAVMHSDGYKEKHGMACATEEHKAKLAESSRVNWADSEYRTKMTAKIQDFVASDSYKAKQSEQSLKKWQNQEYRAKQSEAATRKNTKEFRARISKILKDYWDTEKREAVSDTVKTLWQDDEYRSKTSAASKKAMGSQIVRQRISNRMRNYFVDPANRERLSRTMTKLWAQPEVANRLGKILSGHSIQLWKDDDYRTRVTTAICTSMQNLWADPEYRKRMTLILSKNSKYLWEQQWYRDLTTKAIAKKMCEFWANPEYRKRMALILSKRAKQTWQNPEYREKMAIVRANTPRISSIQLQLYKYLDNLNIEYYKEGIETAIGYYAFDCLIPKQRGMHKHLLIECQGDYWHSPPRAMRNDKSKFTYIDRYFPEHEIMYIWEHEFSVKDRVLDRLKLKLGVVVDTKDFDFKDVVIKDVSGGDIKSFLDAYHYIGKGRGGKCFGAYYGGELIACVVFSSPLRQNTAGQFDLADGDIRELSRLCIHPSYHKKNFASWFISRTIKLINCRLIIAYADTTVGHDGTIYKASNFEFHHRVAPDYWYVDRDGYVMHKRTLYGKACKMSMIESDFAEKYGYAKKWGGKKLCYVLEA